MKSIAKYIFMILCIMIITSCYQQPQYVAVQASQQGVDPQATLGTYNGQQVMYITDNRGEQFMMDYILFNSLFNSGGYNSVSTYYYGHANDYGHIYPYSSSYFHSIRPYGGFYSSYHTAYVSHRVYVPSTAVINNSTSVRRSHYGNVYRPTTYVNNRSTIHHSDGSKTHINQRTTFHSNGKVSQHTFIRQSRSSSRSSGRRH